MEGRRLPPPFGRWVRPSEGWRGYASLTVPPEGVEVEILLGGPEPVEAFLVDRSPGLPPGGEVLLRARPKTAVPSSQGDLTILSRRVTL